MNLDPEIAWNAVLRRDRSFDGRFVTLASALVV